MMLMMDQYHPQPVPCILPSNIPPSLYDAPAAGRAALQERSNNRRDEPSERLSKLWPLLQQTEPAFVANVRRGKFKNIYEDDIPRIISRSRDLWERLQRCEKFCKYRDAQPKLSEVPHNTKDEKIKWSDLTEVAFCRALAAYIPMGRCKLTIPNDPKQRGRNELIAAYIEVETGEPRGRKQVSSHIQVIKPWFEHDPVVIEALHLPKDKKFDKSLKRRESHTRPRRHASAYVPSSRSRVSRYAANQYGRWPQQSIAHNTLESNAFRSHYVTYVPRNFSMRVQVMGLPEHRRIVHEFTSLRRQAQLSSITAPSFERLVTDHHQLADYSHTELLGLQIISAASTIRLVSSRLPSQAEVGIQFSLHNTGRLDRYENFKCRVRFYDPIKLTIAKAERKDDRGLPTSAEYEDTEVIDDVDYDPQKQELGNVHFGSGLWAKKLGEGMGQLRQANAHLERAAQLDGQEALKAEDAAKELKTNLVDSFKNLTALQEISATVRSTGKSERLLLICWKFELCTNEQVPGETTWRNIIVKQLRNSSSNTTMPYAAQPVKQELLSQDQWTEDMMDINSTAAAVVATLQQPFDSAQACALPDFSTLAMSSLPTVTGTEGQLNSQYYTDNDFDFSGGHLQLNLSQQMPNVPIDLVDSYHSQNGNLGNATMLYDQNSNWSQIQYPDAYFNQTQQNGYNVVQAYNEHEDTPFSEAGAQQHTDTPLEQMPSQHNVFPDGLEHIFAAPAPEQTLSPEEALRQHAAYLSEAVSQDLSPQHLDALIEQHGDIPLSHGFSAEADTESRGPEHALQSIEFASQAPM